MKAYAPVGLFILVALVLEACQPTVSDHQLATQVAATIAAGQTATAAINQAAEGILTASARPPTSTSTVTAIPPTQTATPTPAPPTSTPTPSHPSFSRDEVLEIPSVSAIVGEGEVLFAEGEEPKKLRVEINGTVPIVEGNWCAACLDTIRIDPNLQVPTDPFFVDTEAPEPPGGLGLIGESMVLNVVLSSPIPDDSTEFIVSGPKGATLRKVGRGFLLVEGEAYLLQTAVQPNTTAQPTAVPLAPTAAPTIQAVPTSTQQTVPQKSPVEISAYCALFGRSPSYAEVDQPVVLRWGWEAATAAYRQDYVDAASFSVQIDGQPVDPSSVSYSFSSESDDSFRVHYRLPSRILSPGTHQVVIAVTLSRQVMDGYDSDNDGNLDTFGPGTTVVSPCVIMVN